MVSSSTSWTAGTQREGGIADGSPQRAFSASGARWGQSGQGTGAGRRWTTRDYIYAFFAATGHVCDTNYISVAKVRKDWLPHLTPERHTHARLRQIANTYLR